MKHQVLSFIIISTTFFACNSSSKDYVSPSDLAKVPEATNSSNVNNNDSMLKQLLQPGTTTPGTLPGNTTIAATPSTTTNSAPANTTTTQVIQPTLQPTTTKAGANPAHGQPGHRCDIPVGAPLNSPAAKTQPTNQPTTQQVTMPATAVATPVKTKTAPGMNPQHGEPGHRCDISVGAPLNSPVTKPAAVTTPAVTPSTNTIKKDSSGL